MVTLVPHSVSLQSKKLFSVQSTWSLVTKHNNVPSREKTNNVVTEQVCTVTSAISDQFKKKGKCAIRVSKTKALIIFASLFLRTEIVGFLMRWLNCFHKENMPMEDTEIFKL